MENSEKIQVFKFGGASVKSAEGVRNLFQIVQKCEFPLVVVVSAMGKTTNALEGILSKYLAGDASFMADVENLKKAHIQIAQELFAENDQFLKITVAECFKELDLFLSEKPSGDYSFVYDQLVSCGELISTRLVSAYLIHAGLICEWLDARKFILTDSNFREGNVDLSKSAEACKKTFVFTSSQNKIFVTQGFIGSSESGATTTLGREGSDYTAALLANFLDAESVTIWKDVDGVLNADPRIFQETVKLDNVSFKEAVELAYCGAQIIHPKTIKPLQNKQITLWVRSFLSPSERGTRVFQTDNHIEYPPVLILKQKQVLVSLTPKDFSFVIEDCLSRIFATLFKHRVKVNLVQNSAIDFTVCVDDEMHYLPKAMLELNTTFSLRYNTDVELLTIRHYTHKTIENYTDNKDILLQQKTRSTVRLVYRKV